MRKLIVLVVIAGMLVVAVSTAFARTRSVTVGDNYFVRAQGVPTVTIRKGDTVVWRFRGRASHNVTSTSGPTRIRSGNKTSGTYRKRFTRSGTYRIVCTIHGAADQSMRLRVR